MAKASKPTKAPLVPHLVGDDLVFYRDVAALSPDPVQYKPYNPYLKSLEGGTNLLVQVTCPTKWVVQFDDQNVVLKPKGLAYVAKQIGTAIAWMHSNLSISADTN